MGTRGALRERWHAAGDWLETEMTFLKRRARSVAPPSGQQYELWDCAIFVLFLVGVGYVIETPSPQQAAALGWFAQAVSLTAWSSILAATAAFAAVAAYHPKQLDLGYGMLITGCLFWSLAFAIGIVFFDGEPRSFISVLIYGWVVRRLIAVRMRGQ